MKVVNLTPHSVTVLAAGKAVTFEPSGKIARVSQRDVRVGSIGDIPLFETYYGMIDGLPEPEQDTYYIVSGLVLAQATDRDDVIAPNGFVRDTEGKIIGCTSFRKA